MAVTVNKADLEFILEQIKIAEAHAGGVPLYGVGGLIPTYNLSWGLRTVDGSYNNLLHPTWGAADQEFPEDLGTDFRPTDGDPDGPGPAPSMPSAASYNPSDDPNSLVIDSAPRTISNLIVDQTLANPAAIYTALLRAGIEGDLLAKSAEIKAAYDPIEHLFEALTAAQVDEAAATAAAAANPSNGALATAAAAATAARETAEAELATARTLGLDDLLEANGIELEGANVVLPNVAPDEGLSAPFNSWFTLFGQFFDHGLDLVNKGGSGTVFIPLMPDDPLYDPTSPTNFMVLTRATVSPETGGRPVNTTTAFVDQNQTYTSHPSHQVFLRQYVLNEDGHPVATGKLITGANGGMATWLDVKEQAASILGIQLTDSDVGNVPLLATDPYGNFIPGANGFPQMVFPGAGPDDDPILVEGNPAAVAGDGLGMLAAGAIRTGHAFLADIAHNAVPTDIADGDIEIGLGNSDGTPAAPGEYDNELLDAHFIAGDGRANENIGLTAVHHVFHAEHNRMVQQTMDQVLESNDLAFLNEWLLVDVAAVPTDPTVISNLVWDGERLFQSAKFVTEMEYQHLVFEEFARKIQPQINVFLVPDGYDVTIDPSIVAEFAHVVYRFGHSMLTESIDRFDPQYNQDHIGLIEGFLNPMQFLNNGTNGVVDAEVAAGAIVRGMTRQVGNHIDEFVTTALRNNLLGLPLDLATINLARGRDTGVPSLNEVRRQFYEATNEDALLRPYDSWVDFAGHLKNEASIVNFIAAYGNHALITSQTTIEGKRDAALAIITGAAVGSIALEDIPTDALAFLNGTGAYGAGNALGGLENVDLWIGGLAEQTMPFGGMLGSTFNFVFERQLESLQNGDRFYYLQRLDGLHLFGEMENNSFAEMIMTNTDATHLPSDVFSTPGLMLEVDRTQQYNPGLGETAGADNILLDDPETAADESADNLGNDPAGGGILTKAVIRDNPATVGPDSNYLRYTGGEHVVLGGTDQADILIAGIGDDTLFGDGGNDNLEGGFGNDIINGGDGDDIIRDAGGDDNIKAGSGNDVVHGGPGLDLIMGGDGQDFIVLGNDAGTEVFAGQGNDFILGSKNAERILGNEGDDWIETGTFDGAPGDNFDEIFARDGIDGHDVFLGDGGFDEFIAEGGDDIMVGSAGRGKMAGMSGWDWATYKDNPFGVDADLTRAIVFDENPNPPLNGTLDTYESIEGLSGTMFDDLLTGADTLAEERLPFLQGGTEGYAGNVLDWEAAGRIEGLRELMGSLVSESTSYSAGDIILGGDGSDVITGRGGDDVIDGDKWLNVQIGVFALSDTAHLGPDDDHPAPVLYNSMRGLVNAMFAGAIKPEQLGIVRKIETGNAASGIDTAVYAGPLTDYAFALVDGKLTVTDVSANPTEGTDTLSNIEEIRFGSTTLRLNVGTNGDDTLGDDAALLGIGDNLMLGLDGNDTYVVDTTADIILEGAGAGTDTVRSFITYTLADELENLILDGAESINGTGNAADNVIAGNSGSNVLAGEGGVDTVSYASATTGVMVSLTSAGQQVTGGAGTDTLSGFENLEGSAFDDSLTANGVANVLTGGAGNDTLIATIDNVRDTLDGGIGIDTANYAAYAAALNVNLGAVGQIIVNGSGSNAGNSDLLVSVENFIGGSGNDTVTGSGADNILTGGLGSDSLNGAGGNDTLVATVDNVRDTLNGGDGIDTANYSAYTAAGGLTVTLVTGPGQSVVGGSGSNAGNSDVLVSVENFTGGSGSDEITGSDDANILNGGGAADEINGGGGNDTINGGTGGDELNGQGGNDTINGDAGSDIIAGGAGDDIINGGAGNDTIEGGAGIDVIDGGADNDTIEGGAGNDFINGGAGADLLIGGNGADTINAGVADDNLQDIFRFSAASEFGDTVTNFDVSGNGNQRDMVQFSGDFNPGGGNGAAGWDDGNNNNDFLFAAGNGVNGTGAVSVTVGQGNGDAEALILGIAEGVEDLQSTTQVAAAFNDEFVISAANGEDALLVINNTSGTGFSLWQWVQMTGGTAEVDTGELSLIGTFASNGAVAANNFDFV